MIIVAIRLYSILYGFRHEYGGLEHTKEKIVDLLRASAAVNFSQRVVGQWA